MAPIGTADMLWSCRAVVTASARGSHPRRSLAASLLAVVAVVLLPFADLGLWIRREVVSTDAFVRLADEVLDQRAVRVALTERVVAELEEETPELAGQDPTVRSIVSRALRSPKFRPAFREELADVHGQFRDGHDPLELDLTSLLRILRTQLPPTLAEQVPSSETLAPATVLRRRDAPAIWIGVQHLEGAATAIPLITIAVVMLALLVARRRAQVCVGIGIAGALLSVALILLLEPGRSLLEHHAGGDPMQRAAFLAGYNTVTHSLVIQTIVLAIVGVVLALGGIFLSSQRSRHVPSGASVGPRAPTSVDPRELSIVERHRVP